MMSHSVYFFLHYFKMINNLSDTVHECALSVGCNQYVKVEVFYFIQGPKTPVRLKSDTSTRMMHKKSKVLDSDESSVTPPQTPEVKVCAVIVWDVAVWMSLVTEHNNSQIIPPSAWCSAVRFVFRVKLCRRFRISDPTLASLRPPTLPKAKTPELHYLTTRPVRVTVNLLK